MENSVSCRQVVHPWMVHGWSMDEHSSCGIHRYLDRGRIRKVSIHGWPTVASTDI